MVRLHPTCASLCLLITRGVTGWRQLLTVMAGLGECKKFTVLFITLQRGCRQTHMSMLHKETSPTH